MQVQEREIGRDTQTISFQALKRARTTIEDFVLSYFPLHSLKLPEDFFKFLDILVYVEATIYAMDEENERLAGAGVVSPDLELHGQRALLQVLEEQNLLDGAVAAELQSGVDFWRMERRICQLWRPLRSLDTQVLPTAAVTLDDLRSASKRKSFDYRVLHLLLFRLTSKPYDEQLLEFLAVDEHLVDIGDDLVDYEDDVLANSFNIYRGFVHLYQEGAQLAMVTYISEVEQQRDALLAALPAETQAKVKRRQKEAMEAPGSERWVIPTPILDEYKYCDEV